MLDLSSAIESEVESRQIIKRDANHHTFQGMLAVSVQYCFQKEINLGGDCLQMLSFSYQVYPIPLLELC